MTQRSRPAHGGYPAAAPRAPRDIDIHIKPADFMPADAALIVQPGDTLILRYSHPIDAATAAAIEGRAWERLPELGNVLVISCDQLGVYRPAPATDDTAPPYVHHLLDAFLSGEPLNFGHANVPEDVQVRLDAAVKSGLIAAVPHDGS